MKYHAVVIRSASDALPIAQRVAAVLIAVAIPVCAGGTTQSFPTAGSCAPASDGSAMSAAVGSTLTAAVTSYGLNALIFSAVQGTTPILTTALGTSTPGVPATTAMHFRVGMPAEQFEATLALQLADAKTISLDAPISTWFPSYPGATVATTRMLGYSQTGFGDYVYGPANTARGIPSFPDLIEQNPYQTFTADQLIARGLPPYQVAAFSPPGSWWAYSHTNYVMLGSLIEQAAGQPYATLAQARLFEPLGLHDTVIPSSPAIAAPVLHAFTTERGPYEDSTLWDPSWTSYSGNANSTVCDLAVWTRAFGTGALVSAQSAAVVTAPVNVGRDIFSPALYFGFGVLVVNGWLYASGNFFGWHTATAFYAPTQLALVVTVTTSATATNNDAIVQNVLAAVSKQLVPNAPLIFPPRRS